MGNNQLLQPDDNKPLTPDQVFGDDDIILYETDCMPLPVILRGHRTPEQAALLIGRSKINNEVWRPVPGTSVHTWHLFTPHTTDCVDEYIEARRYFEAEHPDEMEEMYPTNEIGEYCGCRGVYDDWAHRAVDQGTPGAQPVTWVYAYELPMSDARLAAEAEKGIYYTYVNRDFGNPKEYERFVTNLRKNGWFDTSPEEKSTP